MHRLLRPAAAPLLPRSAAPQSPSAPPRPLSAPRRLSPLARTAHLALLILVLALALPTHALASSRTGDLRGAVVDDAGAPVFDALVALYGGSLGQPRTLRTEEDGTFRFLALTPGRYELRVEREGYRTETRKGIEVRLDRTTSLTVTLVLPDVEVAVEVTDARPLIDTQDSSLGASVDRSYVENIPVGRSYQDVIRTLPGVSGRVDFETGGPSGGNPSVRGEGQYGNNFLLDGFSTRDPATHTFGSNVNFDAIEGITVFTDGAPAEYGGATGMIANVVSRSGTDEVHGTVGGFLSSSLSCPEYDWGNDDAKPCGKYLILDTEQGIEVPTRKRRFTSWTLNGTLGGPIVKGKLRFFLALDYERGWTQFEGAPDLPDGTPLRSRER